MTEKAGHPAVRSIAAVRTGDRLPSLKVTVTEVSNLLFGVAFWIPHRVHYDPGFARTEGFDAPLIPGALLSAYATRVLVEWAGHPHAVRRVTSRNLSLPLVGATLDITGEVDHVGEDGIVTCALTVASGERALMAVSAHVELTPASP